MTLSGGRSSNARRRLARISRWVLASREEGRGRSRHDSDRRPRRPRRDAHTDALRTLPNVAGHGRGRCHPVRGAVRLRPGRHRRRAGRHDGELRPQHRDAGGRDEPGHPGRARRCAARGRSGGQVWTDAHADDRRRALRARSGWRVRRPEHGSPDGVQVRRGVRCRHRLGRRSSVCRRDGPAADTGAVRVELSARDHHRHPGGRHCGRRAQRRRALAADARAVDRARRRAGAHLGDHAGLAAMADEGGTALRRSSRAR